MQAKSQRISFNLSREEKDIIVNHCLRYNLSMGNWIRWLALQDIKKTELADLRKIK